jgi:SAM-dependent methyltransferase/uncharacterized protein YbaR (Trm112 family)
MNERLFSILRCPRDQNSLTFESDSLVCENGHAYPVVDGVPVMLLDDVEPTHAWCSSSLTLADEWVNGPPEPTPTNDDVVIDPYVREILPATNGNMYLELSNYDRYPIPDLPLPAGNGSDFLEIGCNWGRWCVSAARKDYRVIGLDPSIEAIMAARRVVRDLDVEADFVVGDGRYLPFQNEAFDSVFSFSVMQHWTPENYEIALSSISRVLVPGGTSMVQIVNSRGLRSHSRKGKRKPLKSMFTRDEARDLFGEHIGPSQIRADSFITIDAQLADWSLLRWRYRIVVTVSELLTRATRLIPILGALADSLFVNSTKPITKNDGTN